MHARNSGSPRAPAGVHPAGGFPRQRRPRRGIDGSRGHRTRALRFGALLRSCRRQATSDTASLPERPGRRPPCRRLSIAAASLGCTAMSSIGHRDFGADTLEYVFRQHKLAVCDGDDRPKHLQQTEDPGHCRLQPPPPAAAVRTGQPIHFQRADPGQRQDIRPQLHFVGAAIASGESIGVQVHLVPAGQALSEWTDRHGAPPHPIFSLEETQPARALEPAASPPGAHEETSSARGAGGLLSAIDDEPTLDTTGSSVLAHKATHDSQGVTRARQVATLLLRGLVAVIAARPSRSAEPIIILNPAARPRGAPQSR